MAGGFIRVRRPSRAIDLEEVGQASYAVEQACEGNFGPLEDRLRSGKALLFFEIELLADIVAGKVKRRSRGRPAQPAAMRHAKVLLLALEVLTRRLKGCTHKGAVMDTAKNFDVHRSAVDKAVGKHRDLFGGLLPPLK